MLFTEANMDVVYDFYGNRSTFEYEFEYEYEYVAVFMDMRFWLKSVLVAGKVAGDVVNFTDIQKKGLHGQNVGNSSSCSVAKW